MIFYSVFIMNFCFKVFFMIPCELKRLYTTEEQDVCE